MRKALTLYELNGMIRDVISLQMADRYWVQAELSEVRENNGHCFMELIQKDSRSNTPVAKASAKCWRNAWMLIRPGFERVTGMPLHAGLKVMLLVHADFHENYGFSWIVEDIDPTYTMGDMARKRQEIVQILKEQGVFDLQKQLAVPMFCQRVAVISSATAAGYGDFCHQLENNDYGLQFTTQLFPAVMQGEQVEQSVIAALDRINDRLDDFDVVVMIRGGGATSDMSGFDTLSLAENIANFPLPVITGIGHERDESVLDMISNTRVKTPTAAAAFLVEHLSAVYERLLADQQYIVNYVNDRIEREKLRLNHLASRIPVLFSLVRSDQNRRLEQKQTRIVMAVKRILSDRQERLHILESRLRSSVDKGSDGRWHQIQLLEQRMKALDPELLLKRGYSITLHDGRLVTNADHLCPGDQLQTRLKDGILRSVVE